MAEAALILIADDDPEIRRIVKRALEKLGLRTIQAADGEEALSALLEHHPDGVVLDVMMPGLSGWEICRYARTKAELAQTAILMLTAIGKTVNEMTSPLYGADAYLDKPFDIGELTSTLQRILTERGASAGA